jgi:hypothetical protein
MNFTKYYFEQDRPESFTFFLFLVLLPDDIYVEFY